MESKGSNKSLLISFTIIFTYFVHLTKSELTNQAVNFSELYSNKFSESNSHHLSEIDSDHFREIFSDKLSKSDSEPFRKESLDRPVPLEGLTFSLKRDLNPCHQQHQHHRDFGANDSNPISLCDITTTRVFSSRYRSWWRSQKFLANKSLNKHYLINFLTQL